MSTLELEAQEKEEKKEQEVKFRPLLKYLKNHSRDVVRDGRYFICVCALVIKNCCSSHHLQSLGCQPLRSCRGQSWLYRQRREDDE